MYVRIANVPGGAQASLVEPLEFTSFSVNVDSDVDRGALQSVGGAIRFGSEHQAWVALDWLRAQAPYATDVSARDALEGMIGYARGHDWIDDVRGEVAAHIVDGCPLDRVAISGIVVAGDQRGRELGFPTANLRGSIPEDLSYGVYAGQALGRPAAVNVGVRPTFGSGLELGVEAYILDFEGDLYGREITVELVRRLRDEVYYDDEQVLVEQIRRDVAATRRAVSTEG